MVIAAARPVPGTRADAHAWRASGLSQHCQGVTALSDGAYLNCGIAVPHCKRPGRPLLKGEEDDNAEHRKVRARVEHVIGRMKNYKIIRDCRQRGDGLHHAVQAVARMHNLALAP
jgi:DDE superfamily endonuclease